jgi:hypothetical protein
MDTFFSYSSLKINFNKKLYGLGAIEESLKAFEEFFESKVSVGEDSFLVELNFLDEAGDIIVVREFCNYVLGLVHDNRHGKVSV